MTSNVTTDGATLNGEVNPSNRATTLVLRVRDIDELWHEDRGEGRRLSRSPVGVSAV